jgi:rubrerythrin
MDKWNSVDEVLDFAISGEEAAVEFYTHLAEQAKRPEMREVFEEFAREEAAHKEKLLTVKAGEDLAPAKQAVMDLKIADYLVDVKPSSDMSYQDTLIVAMKKEKAAFKLYNDLAGAVENVKVKTLFLALAQEEAKHKLHFEIEYDNMLTDN